MQVSAASGGVSVTSEWAGCSCVLVVPERVWGLL